MLEDLGKLWLKNERLETHYHCFSAENFILKPYVEFDIRTQKDTP
jgi:hypothetical protein